jgi:hypothetical protein
MPSHLQTLQLNLARLTARHRQAPGISPIVTARQGKGEFDVPDIASNRPGDGTWIICTRIGRARQASIGRPQRHQTTEVCRLSQAPTGVTTKSEDRATGSDQCRLTAATACPAYRSNHRGCARGRSGLAIRPQRGSRDTQQDGACSAQPAHGRRLLSRTAASRRHSGAAGAMP